MKYKCLVTNLSFPLPLLGGRLEGRLKPLNALIKLGFKRYKPGLESSEGRNLQLELSERKEMWLLVLEHTVQSFIVTLA